MPAKISGVAVAEVMAGFVLLWSGIKNQPVGAVVKDLLKGKNPPTVPEAPPTVGVGNAPPGTPGGAPLTGASDSAIASTALAYSGHCYDFGGAPGKNGQGCWDCSSFANYVLGVRLRMAIPGYSAGQYDGTVHGPTTLSYLAWTGAATVGHSSSVAQAGDLCVWQTHMGIATGGGNMISALDPSQGTRETTIDGIVTGEVLYVRRVRG